MKSKGTLRPVWSVVLSALSALAVMALGACGGGGPTGPAVTDPGAQGRQSEFSRTVVVLDGEHDGFGVPDALLDFWFRTLQESGTVDASLSWSVVSPGSGPYGANEPELTMGLFLSISLIASSGASTRSPLTLSGPVDHHRVPHNILIRSNNSCGGCTIRFTLRVMHPPGQVQLLQASDCEPPWAIKPLDVSYDVTVVPPQPRIRVGQSAQLSITNASPDFVCSVFNSNSFHVTRWVSANPDVAAVREQTFGIGDGHGVVTGLIPGETNILAELIRLDGSRTQADLIPCPDSNCMLTTKVTLKVIP